MKKTLILIIAVSVLITTSCGTGEVVPIRNLDGEASGAVIDYRILDNTGEVLDIEIDLYIVDQTGNFVRGLHNGSFTSSGSFDAELRGLNVRQVQQKGPYSAMMLLDQSGSISSTDPLNLRIESANIFADALGSSDHAGLASFTGYYTNDVVIDQEFTNNPQLIKDGANLLLNQEGGGTPLYYATYEMVEYVSQNAPNNNKAVIVFTDGNNTDSGSSLEDVTEHALNNDVQLYTVGLSGGVDVDVLSYMATETDGAFMWAEDAKQLITMFGTLGELLNGSARYYRTAWRVTRDWGTFSSGSRVSLIIEINLPGDDPFEVPFTFYVY